MADEDMVEEVSFGTADLEGWEAKVRTILDAREVVEPGVRARFEEFLELPSLSPRQIAWVARELEKVKRYFDDRALLKSVMETELLTEREQEAFVDMWEANRALTDRQRGWLEGVADRVLAPPGRPELDRGVKSQSHYVPRDRFGMFDPNASAVLPWEKPGYEKPTKPPGKRR